MPLRRTPLDRGNPGPPGFSGFAARVLAAVRRIPAGRVATYGDVAAAAGNPRAARAVGNIMRTCTAREVPCHRVISAGGALGGYGGNLELKRSLLRAEGLLVTLRRVRNFRERRWTPASRRNPR
ncbi:MAG TPA: MGMT family protein [Vicinamibacterales bacterium]|nr:MGMT family protein [Vicinamibacterales bacterium]